MHKIASLLLAVVLALIAVSPVVSQEERARTPELKMVISLEITGDTPQNTKYFVTTVLPERLAWRERRVCDASVGSYTYRVIVSPQRLMNSTVIVAWSFSAGQVDAGAYLSHLFGIVERPKGEASVYAAMSATQPTPYGVTVTADTADFLFVSHMSYWKGQRGAQTLSCKTSEEQ